MENIRLSDAAPVAGIAWNDLQYLSVDPGRLTIIRVPSDDPMVLQDVTAKLASICQEYEITVPIAVVPYSMEFLQIDIKKNHDKPPMVNHFSCGLDWLKRLWRSFAKWIKEHFWNVDQPTRM